MCDCADIHVRGEIARAAFEEFKALAASLGFGGATYSNASVQCDGSPWSAHFSVSAYNGSCLCGLKADALGKLRQLATWANPEGWVCSGGQYFWPPDDPYILWRRGELEQRLAKAQETLRTHATQILEGNHESLAQRLLWVQWASREWRECLLTIVEWKPERRNENARTE